MAAWFERDGGLCAALGAGGGGFYDGAVGGPRTALAPGSARPTAFRDVGVALEVEELLLFGREDEFLAAVGACEKTVNEGHGAPGILCTSIARKQALRPGEIGLLLSNLSLAIRRMDQGSVCGSGPRF